MMEYIYFCGSFSPPTNAHKTLCLETINYFLQNSNNNVTFYFVPASTYYNKKSIQPNIISWEQRLEMVQLLCVEIMNDINNSRVSVQCETFEHDYSCNMNEQTQTPNGYVGTYKYLKKFIQNKQIDKLHILIGQDNLKDICRGPLVLSNSNSNYWANSLHLIANFNFVVFTRFSNNEIIEINDDYWMSLINNIKQNMNIFEKNQRDKNSNYFFEEINMSSNEFSNDIDDIKNTLERMDINTLKEKIIILNSNNEINSISSTKIRDFLNMKPMNERFNDNFEFELNSLNVPKSIIDFLQNSNLYYNAF